MNPYEELKKRLQACVDSPNKDASMCDANSILREISYATDLEIDQIKNLMELYYSVKRKVITI